MNPLIHIFDNKSTIKKILGPDTEKINFDKIKSIFSTNIDKSLLDGRLIKGDYIVVYDKDNKIFYRGIVEATSYNEFAGVWYVYVLLIEKIFDKRFLL